MALEYIEWLATYARLVAILVAGIWALVQYYPHLYSKASRITEFYYMAYRSRTRSSTKRGDSPGKDNDVLAEMCCLPMDAGVRGSEGLNSGWYRLILFGFRALAYLGQAVFGILDFFIAFGILETLIHAIFRTFVLGPTGVYATATKATMDWLIAIVVLLFFGNALRKVGWTFKFEHSVYERIIGTLIHVVALLFYTLSWIFLAIVLYGSTNLNRTFSVEGAGWLAASFGCTIVSAILLFVVAVNEIFISFVLVPMFSEMGWTDTTWDLLQWKSKKPTTMRDLK
jgi:hypothetical protein